MGNQAIEGKKDRVTSVLDVVLMLSDEELLEFVRRMLPHADEETIEDVYDILLFKKYKDEKPEHPFEEVFGEEPETAE